MMELPSPPPGLTKTPLSQHQGRAGVTPARHPALAVLDQVLVPDQVAAQVAALGGPALQSPRGPKGEHLPALYRGSGTRDILILHPQRRPFVALVPDLLAGDRIDAQDALGVLLFFVQHRVQPAAGHRHRRITLANRYPPHLEQTVLGPFGQQMARPGDAVAAQAAPLRPISGVQAGRRLVLHELGVGQHGEQVGDRFGFDLFAQLLGLQLMHDQGGKKADKQDADIKGPGADGLGRRRVRCAHGSTLSPGRAGGDPPPHVTCLEETPWIRCTGMGDCQPCTARAGVSGRPSQAGPCRFQACSTPWSPGWRNGWASGPCTSPGPPCRRRWHFPTWAWSR